jgi:DNA-binding transcriptional ArsR family regulator
MDQAKIIARMAKILSDATRVRLLALLVEEPASVNDLATQLALDQPRVSSHLAILRKAELVMVEKVGRQNIYRVADQSKLVTALDTIQDLGSDHGSPWISAGAAREVRQNSPIRQSRTCYDHLAGVAGVELTRAMLDRGWLRPEDDGPRPNYQLSDSGVQALTDRGVDCGGAMHKRRKFAYGCPDWTERRPHLGGSLGAAILDALIDKGYVRQDDESRVVHLMKSLDGWLLGAGVE